MTAFAQARIGARTHRLIASRYPTVGVFDELATTAEELRVAFLLEAATNDRLAVLARRIALLPDEDIVQGDTASLVMAAFLHADAGGGRFTDGRLGAWYAALDVDTAIAETLYHSNRRLRLSASPFPTNIQIRQLIARIDCALTDLRGLRVARRELYDAADYTASQAFGTAQRWQDDRSGNGIVYDSVRRANGTNVCIYRPPLVLLPVVQGDHYLYRWDAAGGVSVIKMTGVAVGDPP